uniref:PolyA-specific ribonuclease PARN-like n=2 Tax=Rhizophora mucronata TaxID=61149 RepID=A0A2P2KCJ6_RHIMU
MVYLCIVEVVILKSNTFLSCFYLMVTHMMLFLHADFTFIYSKFLAPLPPSMDEFVHYLCLDFPKVIDVNHLMKEIGPQRKVTNIPLAMSYLKSRFFAPIELEMPCQAMEHGSNIHGHNVVRICQLFAKLCYVLKIAPGVQRVHGRNLPSALEAYSNIFKPFSTGPQEASDEEIRIWTNSGRKVSCEDVVFLWGFRGSMTAGMLKSLLQESHKIKSEDFDVRLVERSCAIVVFWQSSSSKTFLDVMNNSSDICGPLREMITEGLKAGGYEIYSRACKLGLWQASLTNALDKSLADPGCPSESDSKSESSQSHNELMIDLDEL